MARPQEQVPRALRLRGLGRRCVVDTSGGRSGSKLQASYDQPAIPQWGDSATYQLTPGGDFETTAWALSGGAQRVTGSDPYAITGTLGGWSLSLPAGVVATSPLTCVAGNKPTVRVVIAGRGQVAVDFLYGNDDVRGADLTAPHTWAPSSIVLPDSSLQVADSTKIMVRVTGLSGRPLVDDVFVDPWNRG